MRPGRIAVAGLTAALLGGCFVGPVLEVRGSTYDQSPAGKYAGAISSFGDATPRLVSRWFIENCPAGVSGGARACAIDLGMTCSEGPALDCRYSAQETVRRRDNYGPPEAREWRTNRFGFAVTGTADGQDIQARALSDAEMGGEAETPDPASTTAP
ncbi:hypothetical protein GCM10009422_15540 [Brevundimonas kwangchunensis]|uniref:Lipoprotein n=1 Tax=Brevundimonas kwangchunensis TaxID=322163 RepID=A0ABN1GVC0_9CAUL